MNYFYTENRQKIKNGNQKIPNKKFPGGVGIDFELNLGIPPADGISKNSPPTEGIYPLLLNPLLLEFAPTLNPSP